MRHVLLVDDDEHVRWSYERFLARVLDVTVCPADGPRQARRILARDRFDAVVSDYRMPGGDGIRLLEAVRRLRPHCLRVLLSSHLEVSLRDTVLREGVAHACVPKSEPMDVADSLRRLLSPG